MRGVLGIVFVLSGCLLSGAEGGRGGGGDDDVPPTPDGGSPGDTPGPTGKRVFVTSMNTNADLATIGGGITGLDGADNMCNNFAGAVGLGGIFQAWISDSQTDAIDRISGTGPWFRMDGQMAFANKANLTTTPLMPVVIDEKGRLLMFPPDLINVWTGTASGGRFNPSTGSTCSDWTNGTISGKGTVGDAGEINGRWTNDANLDCDLQGRLYCIER